MNRLKEIRHEKAWKLHVAQTNFCADGKCGCTRLLEARTLYHGCGCSMDGRYTCPVGYTQKLREYQEYIWHRRMLHEQESYKHFVKLSRSFYLPCEECIHENAEKGYDFLTCNKSNQDLSHSLINKETFRKQAYHHHKSMDWIPVKYHTSLERSNPRLTRQKKRFQCLYCDKSFGKSSHLKDHSRIHSGERPFVCEYCGKAFSQFSNLRTHLRIHTGEKPFKCNVCNKCFTQRVTLRSHLRTHNVDQS